MPKLLTWKASHKPYYDTCHLECYFYNICAFVSCLPPMSQLLQRYFEHVIGVMDTWPANDELQDMLVRMLHSKTKAAKTLRYRQRRVGLINLFDHDRKKVRICSNVAATSCSWYRLLQNPCGDSQCFWVARIWHRLATEHTRMLICNPNTTKSAKKIVSGTRVPNSNTRASELQCLQIKTLF